MVSRRHGHLVRRSPLVTNDIESLIDHNTDSIYEKAHQACLRVNANLKQLHLPPEDRALLTRSGGSTVVAAKIRSLEEDILAKTEKGNKAKRVTDLANVFCEFGARVTPVLQVMVPQSPEYNVPFGCVALIFKVHNPLTQKYRRIMLTSP